MPSENIQWFPGHMAKTRRLIKECLPLVDAVIEILDARIPRSSENPEIPELIGGKPRLTVLAKASLADPDITELWKKYYSENGRLCIFIDSVSGLGMNGVLPALNALLSDKIENYERKGMSGRALRAMVVGIPNAGKSTFINYLAGKRKTKVEDRPGVTLTKQWIAAQEGLDLLDMPGVLWPKFNDRQAGESLAITGAIKDTILDTETIAVALCGRLRKLYPVLFAERYKLGDSIQSDGSEDYEIFESIGRKRGFLISGGDVNYERTAAVLLDEFRAAKIGRITIERP